MNPDDTTWRVYTPDDRGVFRARGFIYGSTPERAAAAALAKYPSSPCVYIYVPYSGEGFLFQRPSEPVPERLFVYEPGHEVRPTLPRGMR